MPLASGYSSKAVHHAVSKAPSKALHSARPTSQREQLPALTKKSVPSSRLSKWEPPASKPVSDPHEMCKAQYAELETRVQELQEQQKKELVDPTLHVNCLKDIEGMERKIKNMEESIDQVHENPFIHSKCKLKYKDLEAKYMKLLQKGISKERSELVSEREKMLSEQANMYKDILRRQEAEWMDRKDLVRLRYKELKLLAAHVKAFEEAERIELREKDLALYKDRMALLEELWSYQEPLVRI